MAAASPLSSADELTHLFLDIVNCYIMIYIGERETKMLPK